MNREGSITEEEVRAMVRPSDALEPCPDWWASLWLAFKRSGLRLDIRKAARLPGQTGDRFDFFWVPTQDWRA